jgi:hypothetical protein
MRKLFDETHELIGWLGMAAILVAYGLLVSGVFGVTDIAYHSLNAAGSFGILYTSFKQRAYPPAVLNIIFMLIAFAAITQIVF